jgi:hypothetical protein
VAPNVIARRILNVAVACFAAGHRHHDGRREGRYARKTVLRQLRQRPSHRGIDEWRNVGTTYRERRQRRRCVVHGSHTSAGQRRA